MFILFIRVSTAELEHVFYCELWLTVNARAKKSITKVIKAQPNKSDVSMNVK